MRRRQSRPESQIQAGIEKYLQAMGHITIHLNYKCPKCSFTTGRYEGFPDIILVSGGVEVKTSRGKLRPNQIVRQKWFEAHNIPYIVARDIDDVIGKFNTGGK